MRKWDWELHTDADRLLKDAVGDFRKGCGACDQLAQRIESGTSTRFFDWVDHMVVPAAKADPQALMTLGFREQEACSEEGTRVFRHDACTLFPVLVSDGRESTLAIRVDDISEFQKMNGVKGTTSGAFNAPVRRLVLSNRDGFVLSAVERRGSAGFVVPSANDTQPYDAAYRTFLGRRRDFPQEDKGLDDLERQVVSDLDWLDKARVADAFIRAERAYWESRNGAAKVQSIRQSVPGLGWGNVDHHTFRSSRRQFSRLIRILALMGMVPRERFYAGARAGWGAQVLEQPDCDIVVFTDVDLAPEETDMDYSTEELSDIDRPGTVGLWTALHGESALQAGLHHVAFRMDFERARRDLKMKGVEMMKPFSQYSFLKQSLTKGENWKVDHARVSALEKSRLITAEQAVRFIAQGAPGSHFESIQRDQGFKGFNQDSVSAIVRETDPRGSRERGA